MQIRIRTLRFVIPFLAVALTSGVSFANCGGDFLVTFESRMESQLCSSPGYCYGHGQNPENGNFEYFYGFHADCLGSQQRPIEEYLCRRQDDTTYTITREGFWGLCDVVGGLRIQAPGLFVVK